MPLAETTRRWISRSFPLASVGRIETSLSRAKFWKLSRRRTTTTKRWNDDDSCTAKQTWGGPISWDELRQQLLLHKNQQHPISQRLARTAPQSYQRAQDAALQEYSTTKDFVLSTVFEITPIPDKHDNERRRAQHDSATITNDEERKVLTRNPHPFHVALQQNDKNGGKEHDKEGREDNSSDRNANVTTIDQWILYRLGGSEPLSDQDADYALRELKWTLAQQRLRIVDALWWNEEEDSADGPRLHQMYILTQQKRR